MNVTDPTDHSADQRVAAELLRKRLRRSLVRVTFMFAGVAVLMALALYAVHLIIVSSGEYGR